MAVIEHLGRARQIGEHDGLEPAPLDVTGFDVDRRLTLADAAGFEARIDTAPMGSTCLALIFPMGRGTRCQRGRRKQCQDKQTNELVFHVHPLAIE